MGGRVVTQVICTDSVDKLIVMDGAGCDVGGGAEPLRDVLSDYYRCLLNAAAISPAGQLETKPGYFLLGQDTTCYGRRPVGQASKGGHLFDALEGLRGDGGVLKLPFDPHEVIENLRRERYSSHFRDEGRFANELLRKAYYLFRPLMGVSTRRHLQKLRLRGWKEIKFPAWPVDTTVDRIHQKLLALALREQGVTRVPFIWFWPDGFSSCAVMTHDIESGAGREFCPELMDLDESFGFRSAFQVVPENRYPVSSGFLKEIMDRGFEVNVHDLKHDGRLYAERAEFERRARQINQYARAFGAQGFRSGILYRNADWYGAFEFDYDMSIPNVAHLDPQRGGCCTVMPFFIDNLIEIPLTCTQDYTLFHILGDFSIDLWKKQIALIREQHGLMSFIVHPDYVIEPRARATYKMLLGYLDGLRTCGNLWTPLPRDVAAWWRQRSQMKIVLAGGEWRVTGPGSARAQVAYASLDGDKVTYSLDS